MKKILAELLEPFYSLRDYWVSYRGLIGLFTSIYFWVALFLCIFLPLPTISVIKNNVNAVFPSVLGFSLTSFVMFLTFFVQDVKESGKSITATFTHFVLVQALAILLTYIFSTMCVSNQFLLYILHFVVLYAFLLIFAVTFGLFELAKLIISKK